jgi:hypothetical protein
MQSTALILWIVFILGAGIYSLRARHPDVRPVAAFMIFAIVFTTIAFSLYAVLTILAEAVNRTAMLDNPIVAGLFLAVVFVPAFFGARQMIRRPPRRGRVRPP